MQEDSVNELIYDLVEGVEADNMSEASSQPLCMSLDGWDSDD